MIRWDAATGFIGWIVTKALFCVKVKSLVSSENGEIRISYPTDKSSSSMCSRRKSPFPRISTENLHHEIHQLFRGGATRGVSWCLRNLRLSPCFGGKNGMLGKPSCICKPFKTPPFSWSPVTLVKLRGKVPSKILRF